MKHVLPLTGAWENQAGRLTWDSPAVLLLTFSAEERPWAAFCELLEHTQQILTQTRCWRLLVQQQAMYPYSADERLWLMTYWMPRAHERGLAYVAVVRPGNLRASIASTAVRTQASRLPGVIRVFESQSAASRWLHRPLADF